MTSAVAHISRLQRQSSLIAAPWQFEGEALCWRCIDLDDRSLQDGVDILSSAEQARAARFRFEIDRNRYVAAHVALRLSLSEVIGETPERIAFQIGPHGKPDLAAGSAWTFNLSHSGNFGLLAVAPRDRYEAIGVDIERINAIDDLPSLARENFTMEEYAVLADFADDRDALRFFLRCWTRKEACLKALGTGLTLPANGFSAGLTGGVEQVSIEAEGVTHSLLVETIFESETSVAAISWCRDLAAARPTKDARTTLASRSTLDNRVISWT